jgi:DNA-binding CsgD family transcriptional regulator
MERQEIAGLLERAAELAALSAAVDATAAGESGVVMVEGPAGIGKTELLRAAVRLAGEAGVLPLTARGGELESEIGLGVVRQLLEQPAIQLAPGLSVEQGLYALFVSAAERRPLLVAVDDVHWADDGSIRWLAYLARRLDGLPLLLLLARRSDEAGAADRVLRRIAAEPAVTVLRPRPLSEDGVRAIVTAALGVSPEQRFTHACRDAAGGNPLLTRELAAAARTAGLRARDIDVPALEELAPEGVSRFVLARLDGLSPAARSLAEHAAILGSRAALRHAAALARLGGTEALEAADELAGAGLMAGGDPLEFVHPVVRTSIYEALPAGRRAGGHARAARLLDDEAQPPPLIAAHLLRAPAAGDSWVVELLRTAAREALPERRVAYLRRAAAEPPPRDERAGLLAELGRAESELYDPAAIEHLGEALRLADDRILRSHLAQELAYSLIEHDRSAEAVTIVTDAIAELSAARPAPGEIEQERLLGLHAVRLNAEQDASLLTPARLAEAIGLAEEGRSPARLELLCAAALVAPGGGASAASTARLATTALQRAEDRVAVAARSLHSAIWALEFADHLDEADGWLLRLQDDARDRSSPNELMLAASARAAVACRRGALADAEQDARLALELARLHDRRYSVPVSAAALILSLAEQGRTSEASELASQAVDPAAAAFDVSVHRYACGTLLLALGRYEDADAAFDDAGSLMRRCGHDFPGFWPWRVGLALSRLALGHQSEAAALAHEERERVEAFGAAGPIGVAHRTLGAIEGGEARLEWLLGAVRHLERSPARLDLARAQLDLGAALRRAGSRAQARDPLRRALDLADRCGAAPLAAQAREELVAAGGRPRRARLGGSDALTASELRVARRAAAGASNRAIAQELFVSVKTVEKHLASVYRKLDVSGRTGLAAALLPELDIHQQLGYRYGP